MKRILFSSALWLLLPVVVRAQDFCPPPPNNGGGICSLEVANSVLREADANLDGVADNRGGTGSFCGGNSAADCVGFPAAEVGFDLIVTDPATQTVTCTAPGADVWIMNASCSSCLASDFSSATLPAGSTTATHLRVVVADVNGDVCPCGPTLSCTFSRERACADGADGDGDGLIDAADPDCCADADGDGFCGAADCDDGDPLIHEPPLPPPGVQFSALANGVLRIDWIAQPSAVVDGIFGVLSDLDTPLSAAACLFNDRSETSYSDFLPLPESGDGYFYLLRAQSACGASTYGRGPALDAGGPCP